jgi:hypothetical protein
MNQGTRREIIYSRNKGMVAIDNRNVNIVAGKRGPVDPGEREPGVGPLAEPGGAPEENVAGGVGPLLPVNGTWYQANCYAADSK